LPRRKKAGRDRNLKGGVIGGSRRPLLSKEEYVNAGAVFHEFARNCGSIKKMAGPKCL
jgi:hypothetical protein